MHETVNPTYKEEVASSETSVQPETNEELDHIPDFVQPLFDLVTSNGDEVRAWPWLGGSEASLRASIYSHPRAQRYLTPGDIPIMMSEVLQTLARKLETDELEEQNDQEEELPEQQLPALEEEIQPEEAAETIEEKAAAEEESTPEEDDRQDVAEAEDKKTQREEPVSVEDKIQPARQVEERDQQKHQAIDKTEKPTGAAVKKAATAPQAAPAEANNVPARITPAATKAEATAATTLSHSAEVTGAENAKASEVLAVNVGNSENTQNESVSEEGGQEFISNQPAAGGALYEARLDDGSAKAETQQPISAAGIAEIGDIPAPDNEDILAPLEEPEFIGENAPEVAAGIELPVGVEVEPLVGEEDLESAGGAAELAERFRALEDEDVLAAHNFPLEIVDSAGFAEKEEVLVRINHSADLVPVPDEQYIPFDAAEPEAIEEFPETGAAPILLAEDDRVILTGTETSAIDQAEPISRVVEEVKDSLVELAERIEASEPELAERANEKLDKIIEVTSRLESDSGEDAISEAEAQEKLEELFTELFEQMGIDYTPELVETAARFAITAHEAKREKDKDEDEEALPTDSGTHEAIAQILVGLNAIDEAIEYASVIGKSALRLCRFRFAMA